MQSLLQAHRIKTTLTQKGILTLDHLPFQAGEAVEVIVLPYVSSITLPDRYPLRGTFVQYRDPIEPVAEQDWDLLP